MGPRDRGISRGHRSLLDAGDIVVFTGTSATQAGYQSTGARALSQNTSGIPDAAEGTVWFGRGLWPPRPGIRETRSAKGFPEWRWRTGWNTGRRLLRFATAIRGLGD